MLTVTVVIPTCRRPLWLKRALRSVARQTRVPHEVIIVNDAAESLDEVRREAVSEGDLRSVHVVDNVRTAGASGARNTGADHGRGAWLAFLDDDDEWLPAYLATALARIETESLDTLCTDFLYRYDDGTERFGKAAPDRLAPELFLTRNPGLIGSNLIVRRSLYLEIDGFEESLPSANDIDFGLRLSLRGGVRYAPLHTALVRHYRHGGQRISMPRSPAVRAGLRRFFQLHAHRMTPAQRAEFQAMTRRVWGIDEFGNVIA